MLDAAVDDAEVSRAHLARVVADRHRDRPVEDQHHLLGVVVAVPCDRRPGRVGHAPEEHLVAGDRLEPDPRKQGIGLPVGEGSERRFRHHAGTSKVIPPCATVFTESSASNTTVLPARAGARFGVERAQHLLGRDRQLGDPDPDRVVDGRRDRGRLRVVRHLADPLRAVRTVGGGVLDDDRVDLREVLEPRREIRAELPAAVIDRGVVRVAVLEHAEPEALHGAPLDLPLDEGGVDGEPDVVDLDEARHAHHAGLVVDLHLGRAGRVRDRGVGGKVDLAGLGVDDRRERLQLRARPGDQLAVRPRRRGGHVRDGDLLLRRALCQHLAVDDLEVGRVDLELLARDVEDPLANALGCLLDRLAGDERGP